MKSTVLKITFLFLLLGVIVTEDEINPEAKVVFPIRRDGTEKSQLGVWPCGGVTKLLANTLAIEGSRINFVWETINPEANGNCTVSISNGFETEGSFTVLNPIKEYNNDGSFECGREKGLEKKEFQLPPDWECDRCIMQWKWQTSSGIYYSCSDIIINGTTLAACSGKCQNGGQCFNGGCICLPGFTGDFCETKPGKKVPWLLILLGLLAAGLLAGVIYMYLKRKNTRSWKTNKESNTNQPFNNEEYFPES